MMLDLIAESSSGERQHRNALRNLMKRTDGIVRIASAYVTDTDLLSSIKNRDVRLLTYLSKMDIVVGASSLESLTALIKAGVKCRYMSSGPRLHAKVYVFDDQSAVVTSANLTRMALNHNIEVGVHLSACAAQDLRRWFDTLWEDRAVDELDLALVS
jgi:phosphatidylserine/phosphatidylglycerophosphate/cardiolipin synthase-like enzyme